MPYHLKNFYYLCAKLQLKFELTKYFQQKWSIFRNFILSFPKRGGQNSESRSAMPVAGLMVRSTINSTTATSPNWSAKPSSRLSTVIWKLTQQ
jgi:hypothetical protein